MHVKRTDFSEETCWMVDCPVCETVIEVWDDPAFEFTITCESCGEVIDIED